LERIEYTDQSKITAVISFCSNDWRFLKRCVSGVSPFCERIILTTCDHFFDGSKENYALLEEAFRRFPDCTFLEFNFDPQQSYRPFSPFYPEHHNWRHEWHNTGRWLSYFYTPVETEFLLFLDCDEIVDSRRFIEWLKKTDLQKNSAYRFACFWYFREAKFEALVADDFSMLVKKKAIDPDFLWDEHERMGLFQRVSQQKRLSVRGHDGIPMIRHYSGVRTKEELIKKFSAWGHHWERDWNSLIQEEFSRPFNGKDFIRRYPHREVQPVFDPLLESIPQLPEISYDEHLKNLHRFPNVIMVSKKETFRRQLEYEFSLEFGNGH
jgi:hypothetical protein